jgi:hypothetical protein
LLSALCKSLNARPNATKTIPDAAQNAALRSPFINSSISLLFVPPLILSGKMLGSTVIV